MIRIESETLGFRDLVNVLLRDLEADALSPVARAGEKVVQRIQSKLSERRGPPAAPPGEPPAKRTGALHDSIGRTGPYVDSEGVAVDVGVGVGDEASARAKEWKSRGENVFAEAWVQERGGEIRGGRRLPPRPFIRPALAELKAEIEGDWRRAL